MAAREGAAWLTGLLEEQVLVLTKSAAVVLQLRDQDVVVDDDESWLLLVSALGPTSMTPARFMAMVEADYAPTEEATPGRRWTPGGRFLGRTEPADNWAEG